MPGHDSISETPGMFAGRWWTMVLRGVVAILFAVLAYAWPSETLGFLFGGYASLDGICMLIAAIGRSDRHGRWLLALEGMVGVCVGVVVLMLTPKLVLKPPAESTL